VPQHRDYNYPRDAAKLHRLCDAFADKLNLASVAPIILLKIVRQHTEERIE